MESDYLKKHTVAIMKKNLSALAVTMLLTLGVWGCSDSEEAGEVKEVESEPSAAPKPIIQGDAYQLLESFNVGDGVFVRSLLIDDKKNTLWVGTSVGIHEIDLASMEPLNTFTRESGLANEYVFGIHVDAQGRQWFGTNGGGISRFDHGEWKTYFPMHGLADYWIYSFAEQEDGLIWIGTWAGANLYDPATDTFKTYFDELVNEWVYGLGIDSKKNVWFGTEGGVSMFDGKQWKEWTHAEGLGAENKERLPVSDNTGLGTRDRHDLTLLSNGADTYNPSYVFDILIDNNDAPWAGTWGGGASRYDGEKWINLTTEDGLAGNIVMSIAQDSQGAYWFGTNNGVSRYDGKTWQSFNKSSGMMGDYVYDLVAHEDGTVWAATLNGVTQFGPKQK